MAQPDPYSRVYWRIQDEYPDVFDDPLVLGTWLQLLILAEGSHPAAAHLPRKVMKKPLKHLTDAGLILLERGDRYRVKGLAEERNRRSEQGRIGGLASGVSRTNVQRTSNGRSTNGEPRRDETRIDKTRQDAQGGLKPLRTILEAAGYKPPRADE